MGCTQSKSATTINDSPVGSARKGSTSGVQDDARSFRSKLGAIKMLMKNKQSNLALREYLTTQNKAELLICHQDLEEIKHLTDEQLLTRVQALVWRYKAQYEAAKQNVKPNFPIPMEIVIWECLGRLRHMDCSRIDHDTLVKTLSSAQNDILSKLIVPFEGFLNSKFYRAWQEQQVEDEKKRNANKKYNSGPPSIMSTSIHSMKSETFSQQYSDVLIVDDSIVTLKLTGLTLEKDGHTVDRAANGQIALEMLKQRLYDVVLIDLNMPVMDGFETIRLFREYERSMQQNQASAPSSRRVKGASRGGTATTAAASAGNPTHAHSSSNNQSRSRHHDHFGRGEGGEEEDDGDVSDLSDDGIYDNSASSYSPYKAEGAGYRLGSTGGNRSRDGLNETGIEDYSGTGLNVQDLEQLRRIRSMDGSTLQQQQMLYPQIIIGMSTNVDPENRKRALDAGMDYFLPKPFTLQKFTEIIKISMQQSQLRQSHASLVDHSGSHGEPVHHTQNSAFSP